MVRWMLGLGCFGAGTLLALEALYTIKTQKKKRKKNRKEKGLRFFFFLNYYLVLVLNCKQGLQKYLSFILSERVFLKSLLGFIFLFLFTFAFVWGIVWGFFFSFPPLIFFVCLFVLFSYQKIGKPDILISLFPTNHGFGAVLLYSSFHAQSHTIFSWELSSRQSHLQAKKSLEKDSNDFRQGFSCQSVSMFKHFG